MQVQSNLTRIATAAIVTAAVAVPSASAMPIDGPRERSVAGSQTETRAGAATRDLRTEASKSPSTSPAPPAGLPTWPSDPEPIVPAPAEPAAATDGDGGGLDWPAVLIIAAGAVALGGGLAVSVQRLRAPRSRAAH